MKLITDVKKIRNYRVIKDSCIVCIRRFGYFLEKNITYESIFSSIWKILRFKKTLYFCQRKYFGYLQSKKINFGRFWLKFKLRQVEVWKTEVTSPDI